MICIIQFENEVRNALAGCVKNAPHATLLGEVACRRTNHVNIGEARTCNDAKWISKLKLQT